MDRRSFLLGSAALAGTAAFGLRSARAAEPFGPFTVGIQSYTFRNFELEQALKKTQECGLKYGEFYSKHIDPKSSPEKIKAFLKLCGEYEIKPVAFGVQSFTKDHDANKKLFEFGAALSIKAFSADPNPDSFDSLDKLCDEYKIAIAIHPHGPVGGGKMHRWRDAESIMKAVKDHNKLIGTCLDTGHLIRAAQLDIKLDPIEQIKIMGDRNFGLHLKDHDNKKKTDVPYGDPAGVLDVLGVLKALQEVKFAGYISIEYEANPNDPSADVKKCVAYMQEQVKKLG
jgi:sugar phosphate isomerase/epimerase